jgi:bile acid-coenzyme A ligase
MALTAVGQILTNLAAIDPGRPALTCEGETLTRAQLESRSNRLARAYAKLGVGEGDFVTVALRNGIEFFEACWAVWKLGATPQPISWRLPRRERDQIIALVNPALIVGADASPSGASAAVPAGFKPDTSLRSDALPATVAPAMKAIATGGSTGLPKLVVTTQRGEFDPDLPGPLGMEPHQVNLVAGPLYHNAPFASTTGAMLGQHLVVLRDFDAEKALEAIEAHRVNYVQLVPTMMHRMWRVIEANPTRYDLRSLEAVWHLAAPCPEWLKEVWIDLVGPEKLHELYAGTELQAATTISGAEWLDHRGSVGKPLLGEVKIVTDDGDDAPPGVVGEIYLRRGQDAPASYRYVGAEAVTLPGGWESLGDLGSMDADGYLYIADRRTDLILTGGANVYPAEVEAALLEHPLVLSCAVVGLPDDDLGARVHAVVQLSDQSVVEDELRAFVAERLVRYKMPRSFRFVDTSLRDQAGKVRRAAVRSVEIEQLGV